MEKSNQFNKQNFIEEQSDLLNPKKVFDLWYKRKSIKTNMHYYVKPIMKTLNFTNLRDFKEVLKEKEKEGILFMDTDGGGEYFIILKKHPSEKIYYDVG